MDRRKDKRAGLNIPTRKPSIKITVSADLPESCSSPETPPPLTTVLKRVVAFGDEMKQDGSSEGATLTSNSITRVTVDESLIDFPSCVDFGIKDFLCNKIEIYNNKDEIDYELSSDTDTSFLDAAPPHRFSDSELDGQFDIMSITLDTALNLGPKPSSWNNILRAASKDDLFSSNFKLQTEKSQNDEPEGKSANDENKENTKADTHKRSLDSSKNGNKNLPPLKPFRRNISLPASIFMSLLLESQSQANKSGSHNNQNKNIGDYHSISKNGNDQLWNSWNRKNDRFATRKLTKIDGSYSSQDSTDETFNNQEQGDTSSAASECSGSTPVYSNLEMDRKETLSVNDELDGDDLIKQAFTSEIEKKSLFLRWRRRLYRQDTTGNFAPPDYCI